MNLEKTRVTVAASLLEEIRRTGIEKFYKNKSGQNIENNQLEKQTKTKTELLRAGASEQRFYGKNKLKHR